MFLEFDCIVINVLRICYEHNPKLGLVKSFLIFLGVICVMPTMPLTLCDFPRLCITFLIMVNFEEIQNNNAQLNPYGSLINLQNSLFVFTMVRKTILVASSSLK